MIGGLAAPVGAVYWFVYLRKDNAARYRERTKAHQQLAAGLKRTATEMPEEVSLGFEELMTRFALALGIGLLIGLERAGGNESMRRAAAPPGSEPSRFPLCSARWLPVAQAAEGAMTVGGGIIIAASFAAYSVVMLIFSLEENRAEKIFSSATTAVAAMLTFALGAYAIVGDHRTAAALTVATAAILALREPIHERAKNITWPELRSRLLLLAVSY